MKYMLVTHFETVAFVTEINKLLAKGWRPAGGPFVFKGHFHGEKQPRDIMAQALVLTPRPEPALPSWAEQVAADLDK